MKRLYILKYALLLLLAAPVAAQTPCLLIPSALCAQINHQSSTAQTSTTAQAHQTTLSDVCKPAIPPHNFGRCDLTGFSLSIPFQEGPLGEILVKGTIGNRNAETLEFDTGAVLVTADDTPTTEELKGAETVNISLADGTIIKQIVTQTSVCVKGDGDYAICELTEVGFTGKGGSALLGTSFHGVFTRLDINRISKTIGLYSHTSQSHIYIFTNNQLYQVENLGN